MLKNRWVVSEIAGFEIFDEAGQKIGVLVDVLPTGANDVFVIKSELPRTPEVLMPALHSYVVKVDIPNKRITVSLPPGYLEIYKT